ncbi:hypothetical protein ElyMa_004165300 [Elysia marginata]|uniref:Secreted protein n=1 Tax=Elysia marginata TaxID=1093978 RepID=A0AAV4GI03_9GAST|nr:hypothetical protein ElyMa_004165300 [Elysia marginata]
MLPRSLSTKSVLILPVNSSFALIDNFRGSSSEPCPACRLPNPVKRRRQEERRDNKVKCSHERQRKQSLSPGELHKQSWPPWQIPRFPYWLSRFTLMFLFRSAAS